MKSISRISIILLGALNGFAWGPDGHMIVAAIAWNNLTPAVKKEATRLLKENPDYDNWTNGAGAANIDQIAFITAATWPDEIKGERNYDNSEGDHPTKGAESGQNIGYDDKLQHRYWHFYDTPYSADGTETKPPDVVNAFTQIPLFTTAIKTSSDDSIRSYDLVWLLHLVGDVHQPLHATSRFNKAQPNGDAGGNLVTICSAAQEAKGQSKTCRSELHGFWDSAPGPNKGAMAAAAQAAKLQKATASAAAISDPEKWISESFDLARKDAYMNPPIEVGKGPYVLTKQYRAQARKVVDQRLALAGARLAKLLNDNLTPTP